MEMAAVSETDQSDVPKHGSDGGICPRIGGVPRILGPDRFAVEASDFRERMYNGCPFRSMCGLDGVSEYCSSGDLMVDHIGLVFEYEVDGRCIYTSMSNPDVFYVVEGATVIRDAGTMEELVFEDADAVLRDILS